MFPTLIDSKLKTPLDLGPKPKILIVRLSAIGDCILTMPMVNMLKKAWPTSQIHWIVDCGVSQLLENYSPIDRVIRLQKGFLLRPKEMLGLRRQLRDEQYDLVIDAQGLFKSGMLSWLTGCPRRHGFDRCHAREGASLFYSQRRHPLSEHIAQRHLELLEMCDIPMAIDDGVEPSYCDYGWQDDLLESSKIQFEIRSLDLEPNRFIAINPGAGWESKRWPIDRYAELADQIFSASGLRSLVVWGNARELELARTLVALSPKAAVLAPETDLLSLSQWLHRARLFIGSDTGPMHMAAATGTTCLALYGTTLAQRSGPYGPNHQSIQRRYDGGSSRYRRRTTNMAMKAIQVQDVFEVCMGKLQGFALPRVLSFDFPARQAA